MSSKRAGVLSRVRRICLALPEAHEKIAWEPEPPEPFEMATVLETGDQSLIAVAKSLLESAGIPCIARNERLQNLFGWGAVGTGFNAAMGPIRLQVPNQHEATARELLTALPVPSAEDE